MNVHHVLKMLKLLPMENIANAQVVFMLNSLLLLALLVKIHVPNALAAKKMIALDARQMLFSLVENAFVILVTVWIHMVIVLLAILPAKNALIMVLMIVFLATAMVNWSTKANLQILGNVNVSMVTV